MVRGLVVDIKSIDKEHSLGLGCSKGLLLLSRHAIMCSQKSVPKGIGDRSMTYWLRVSFMTRFCPFLSFVAHNSLMIAVSTRLLRVTSLYVFTWVVVSCIFMKLLKELLLMLKLNVILLNDGSRWIVFYSLDKSQSLLFFDFVNKLELLLRIIGTTNLF